jgi:hypothetical protein
MRLPFLCKPYAIAILSHVMVCLPSVVEFSPVYAFPHPLVVVASLAGCGFMLSLSLNTKGGPPSPQVRGGGLMGSTQEPLFDFDELPIDEEMAEMDKLFLKPFKAEHNIPQHVPSTKSLSGLDQDAPTSSSLCRGWCGKTMMPRGRIDCAPSGIERIRLAFQDENCAVAMQSTSSANLVGQKIAKVLDNDLFVFFRGSVTLFDYDIVCNHADLFGRHDPHTVPQVS